MLFEVINNFNSDYKFNTKAIHKILLEISQHENRIFKSINFILTTDHHLNSLKIEYFNKDHYTDVIAFNLENSNELIDGEIYISMDRIIENANQFNCHLNDELKRIIIHGVLHLMGYNDIKKNDKELMTRLEDTYMRLDSSPIII